MYPPAEDSFLLSETLKLYLKDKHKNIKILDTKKIPIKNFRGAQESFKILDMGSGSGVQSDTCLSLGFKNITLADIDGETIKHLKNKFKNQLKIIKSDLFSNIKAKFNLIVFNPPYLPEDKFDREKDTTAGKKGYEIILRFLKQAKSHLEARGVILLLLSSFTPRKEIDKIIKKYYSAERIAEKNLFFEKLEVLKLEKIKNK